MPRARKSIALLTIIVLAGGPSGCDKKKEPLVERRHREVEAAPATSNAKYVGAQVCGQCHKESIQAAVGSRHDGSLRELTTAVGADLFNGQTATGPNTSGEPQKAAFIRQEGQPKVVVDQVREAKFLIGKAPLIQPLIAGERGQLLVPPFAYDTRKKWEGGQRWFTLESSCGSNSGANFLASGESYNSRCASCHSTHVTKGYELDSDSFDTKRGEVDVSCESCHGPGSVHAALAKKFNEEWPDSDTRKGFDLALSAHEDRRWFRATTRPTAKLMGVGTEAPKEADELSACGPCHSSSTDWGPSNDDRTFLDRYSPTLLQSDAHFPDGQAKVDQFAWGDFLQSSMHQAGVVCSDCHDPHSTILRKPAETLCFQCHSADTFDKAEHHLHQPGTDPAPGCVDCHMPSQARMGIDTRHDHRFSVPRPDLSPSTEAPDACTTCHQSKTSAWAARAIADVHGAPSTENPALAFHAVEKRRAGAALLLAEVLRQEKLAAWTRASALVGWAKLDESFLGDDFLKLVTAASAEKSPLLREAAAQSLKRLSAPKRRGLIEKLCDDAVRSVRIACAVSLLQDLDEGELTTAPVKRAMADAKKGATYIADTQEGLVLLARIELALKNKKRSLALFEMASQRFSKSAVVIEQWARALLFLKRTGDAAALEEAAIQKRLYTPWLLSQASSRLVKAGKFRQALPLLKEAFESAPPHLRRKTGYSYAITVNELGDWAEALAILRLLKKELPKVDQINEAITLIEQKR